MTPGRPRPLFRARALEEAIGTPARLYYKSEFFSPTGRHKVNTALAQAYYAREEGYERVATETGAGQWGTALAYAAALTGLRCTVYWVRAVYRWRTARLNFIKMLGADVHASQSDRTEFGRTLEEPRPPRLSRNRHFGGSRGCPKRPQGGLLPRVGAQPRSHSPDHYWPRDPDPV